MPNKKVEKNSKDQKNVAKKNSTKNNTKKNEKKVEKVEVKNVEIEKTKPVKEKVKGECELRNNTPFVIAACCAIILLGALILTLCTKRIPRTKDGEEIIATLKGKRITADDLYQQLKNENGTSALINLVDDYIANKEVKVTDEDKDYVQEVVDYYKQYAEYYNTDLKTFLANYVGLSNISDEDEFYDYVLNDYKKTLAVRKFVGDQASEKDLKNYYNENYTDKLTVRHILIEVDSEAEDKDKADEEALEKAKKLIKKLNNTDSEKLEDKVSELAKNNSDDTGTYSDGGLLKDFSKSDVVEEFWTASEALKDGEYTKEPVKTTYGYHVIYKVGSKAKEKYKDVKDQVKKEYAESLLSSDSNLQITKWAELRKQYKFSIKDDEMKKAYKKSITVDDSSNNEEASDEE